MEMLVMGLCYATYSTAWFVHFRIMLEIKKEEKNEKLMNIPPRRSSKKSGRNFRVIKNFRSNFLETLERNGSFKRKNSTSSRSERGVLKTAEKCSLSRKSSRMLIRNEVKRRCQEAESSGFITKGVRGPGDESVPDPFVAN